jgi:hypothetical protein
MNWCLASAANGFGVFWLPSSVLATRASGCVLEQHKVANPRRRIPTVSPYVWKPRQGLLSQLVSTRKVRAGCLRARSLPPYRTCQPMELRQIITHWLIDE